MSAVDFSEKVGAMAHSANQIRAHLQAMPFFAGLSDELLVQLVPYVTRQHIVAGAIVFWEGDMAPGLYYLVHGWIKVVKSSIEGREQVLRILSAGDTFHEIGAFVERPNPATAIALEPSDVWLVPRAAIMHLVRTQPDFAQRVVENMADRMINLVNLVADLSLRSVTGRLARLLLEVSVNNVVQRPRWHTQAELASQLGTVPDVVQRALRTLEQKGVIEVQRHAIHIHKRHDLEQLAS